MPTINVCREWIKEVEVVVVNPWVDLQPSEHKPEEMVLSSSAVSQTSPGFMPNFFSMTDHSSLERKHGSGRLMR